MAIASSRNHQTKLLDKAADWFSNDTHEFMVFCPGCGTVETLWFNNGWLTQTRKFSQQGYLIFHDCGSPKPCRLYRHY